MSTSIKFECDRCDATFDPSEGGVCGECGRTLCALHLFGFVRALMPRLVAKEHVCTECRRGR